jgi:tRNA(adenine34) deaminase
MTPATMRDRPPDRLRRRTIIGAASAALCVAIPPSSVAAGDAPDIRWYRAADAMKKLAESWGDQPYGAVVVQDGVLVGEGPSRVVKDGNPDAHAERVAIRDALDRLRRPSLHGAILYSTSRPCSACEAAAADAGIGRMIFGPGLIDAGRPRAG